MAGIFAAILYLFGRFNVRLFFEIASGFISRNIDEVVPNNFRNIILLKLNMRSKDIVLTCFFFFFF